MQVAVKAPNQASFATREKERAKAGMGSAAPLRQTLGLRCGKKIGSPAECGAVLLDIFAKRRDPWFGLDRAGAGVKCCHRVTERIGERRINLSRLCQAIERRVLVEAAHFERPFHGRAGSVELEPVVALARDGHHAEVDVGRE